MQSELKPCPSCGPDGHIELHGSIARGGRFVRCEICGFQGPSNCNQREAITAWNTRASDAEITRLTEALRAADEEKKALREALGGMLEYATFSERWQDQHPEYLTIARQAIAGAKP